VIDADISLLLSRFVILLFILIFYVEVPVTFLIRTYDFVKQEHFIMRSW
jgi:hypothetical protein